MQNTWRIRVLWFFLTVAVAGVLWRLIDLSIIQRPFLLKQSQARILRRVNIASYRGMILDRLGSPLAISAPVISVWVNPQLFKASDQQEKTLAKCLHLSLHYLRRQWDQKHRWFVYLKRDNPPVVAKAIKKLKIPGVFFQTEYRRFYPDAAVTAHIIGITNIDDQGQEGLELAYNNWLSGSPGKKEVLKDRLGNTIAQVAFLKKPVQGKNLVLSIDHRIQYVAFNALKNAVKQTHAEAGSVVVLNDQTGEVLAMVNYPSYNPNNRPKDTDGRYRNRAVTDMFEPGSVIKPFTITLALQSGKYKPSSEINTSPGWMMVGGYKIEDDGLDYGTINLTELLQKSSNIAAAKILLSLSPQADWNLLHEFGFGERTQSGFPGESSGELVAHDHWEPSVVAALAYGYGVAVTTLQLAKAYAILANGGVAEPISLLKLTGPPIGRRVITEKIANTIVGMLETVVQNGGTGTLARVPGYRVAGKTGTAYIAGPNGYNHHRHMASFVGLAPVSDPRLVVAVAIRDPKEKHFGGLVAAPVFAKVMAAALRLLNIPPDIGAYGTASANDRQ